MAFFRVFALCNTAVPRQLVSACREYVFGRLGGMRVVYERGGGVQTNSETHELSLTDVSLLQGPIAGMSESNSTQEIAGTCTLISSLSPCPSVCDF